MYNSERTIIPLLDSIGRQDLKEFEVIIVDDGSTDNSLDIVEKYNGSFNIETLRMPQNSGPAAARNYAASRAKGDILFFLDSDLYLEDGALKNVAEFFKDPTAKCMIGVYSKFPATPGNLAFYKSLQNYYYYTTSKVDRVSFFWGGIGAVRKEIFQEIGNFDTSYKGADYEDYEFGRRVLKKYPIHLRRDVTLRHHFSNSLCKNFKDHFKRSSMWMNIFLKERKFDNYVTTRSHGLGKASGFLFLLSLFLGIMSPYLLFVSIVFFTLFFLTNRKFFLLAFKEKGLLFFLSTVFYDLVFSIAVTTGVIKEVLVHIFHHSKKEPIKT